MQSSVISKLQQRKASPPRMTPGPTTSLTLRFQYRDFHTVLAEGIPRPGCHRNPGGPCDARVSARLPATLQWVPQANAWWPAHTREEAARR